MGILSPWLCPMWAKYTMLGEKMKTNPIDSIRGKLEEYFASIWKLLSDTNHFLSRANMLPQYESRIRQWRREMELRKTDSIRLGEIRREIVAFRKELREQGYNLRLGNYEIEVSGFRSDDALALGFVRAVLCDTPKGIFALAGQANHIELEAQLSSQLRRISLPSTGLMHFIWYRWDNRLLRISGADSELPDHFLQLQQRVSNQPMRYIAAFKEL